VFLIFREIIFHKQVLMGFQILPIYSSNGESA
jgi:hypothetical protein